MKRENVGAKKSRASYAYRLMGDLVRELNTPYSLPREYCARHSHFSEIIAFVGSIVCSGLHQRASPIAWVADRAIGSFDWQDVE